MSRPSRAGEEWRALEAAVRGRYLISSHGRVFDLVRERLVATTMVYDRRKPHLPGLIQAPLRLAPSRTTTISVAYWVLRTFVGPGEPGSTPAFRNGDRADLHVENLHWTARVFRLREPPHPRACCELALRGDEGEHDSDCLQRRSG